MPKKQNLAAGGFSTWLAGIRTAHKTDGDVDVPCGECIACCTSFYFIHIGQNEKTTLARIPDELLFPAPGLPKGHVLMGYDKDGRCPMLRQGKCSIYENRPLTCRQYDCRIFAAVGFAAGDDDKAQINNQAQRWEFSHPTDKDRDEHAAVQNAIRFFQQHKDIFPENIIPTNPSQLALFAIKVYEIFLSHQNSDMKGPNSPDSIAQAVMEAEKIKIE